MNLVGNKHLFSILSLKDRVFVHFLPEILPAYSVREGHQSAHSRANTISKFINNRPKRFSIIGELTDMSLKNKIITIRIRNLKSNA